jgi:hypothetical protein
MQEAIMATPLRPDAAFLVQTPKLIVDKSPALRHSPNAASQRAHASPDYKRVSV